MISEWKGKVSMPHTLVSDYRLKTHVCLHRHLSRLEAHTIVEKLTNEFPRGIELGFALGFCLHKRSPKAAISQLEFLRPVARDKGRELLKTYEFKGVVDSLKPGKDNETYRKWLHLRFPSVDKDV